ncbi:hypothetical protein FRC12_000551 [Ceratobasidium sp. 428]|nr:hypothetical protein FRC12_000551 [Ceratobasidium sp. 428]
MESSRNITVFNEWNTAKDNFEDAAQKFLSACTSLLQYIDESLVSHANRRSIEDSIIAVHGQMKTFDLIESRMTKSKVTLRRVFNESTTLVPINTLPLEVMSHIFVLLVSYSNCTAEAPCYSHPLRNISTVCSRWRHLTVITRSLWSHIDICEPRTTSENSSKMISWVRLCLERACDTPLQLHICQPSQNRNTGSEELLLSLLTPHMANVTSIKFSGSLSEGYFRAALSLYANHRSTGRLESLLVELKPTTGAGATHHLIWPTTSLHGIVDLQLIGLTNARISPGMNGLVAVLLNSPGLRTLRLRDVDITANANYTYPQISVPCLRFLELSLSHNQALSNLLSALVPGSHELELLLELPTSANDILPIQITSFLRQANVVCFGLENSAPDVIQLAKYLDCMPRIKILGFDCSKDKSGASLNALAVKTQGDQIVPRCPSLRLLYLMEWEIDYGRRAQLERIFGYHHLSTIVLDDRVGTVRLAYEATLSYLHTWPRAGNVFFTRSQFSDFFGERQWVPYL